MSEPMTPERLAEMVLTCPKCGNPNYAPSSSGEIFSYDALWICDDPDCPATIDERDLFALRQREADLLAALKLAAEPLLAIQISVRDELCDEIKQAVAKANDAIRPILQGVPDAD
jgi:hypothetical protein